jgi:uncharacterized membrane protein
VVNNEARPERLMFFSDAVIAIAMTLLALDLPVPFGNSNAEMWRDFRNDWHSDYFPFLLSFLVIALFWNAHHDLFQRIGRLGNGLMPLNFAFLLGIVLVPFVTRVLGKDGGYQIGVVLYAVDLAALALLVAALAIVARKQNLLAEGSTPDDLSRLIFGMVPTAIVFLLSIPVALASPKSATWLWLLLLVVGRTTGPMLRRFRTRQKETP